MAGFIKKGLGFAKAYYRWQAAGKPLRDEEYIFDLFDNKCKGCPFFIPDKKKPETHGECDSCGCHIKRLPADVDDLNKLAWPTEGCPEDFWEADVDEPE
jgi:hypothetical protein